MIGIHDFIIQLEKPLNDTFKTESGLELYANKDFSVDRLANRVAKVISTPLLHDSVIKPGYEVMFEITILYKQIYQGRTQQYTALLDTDKNLFKLTPNMIILYRENSQSEWKGHLDNCLLEPIKDCVENPTSSLIIVPENTVSSYKKNRAIVKYSNSELEELGVFKNDEVVLTSEFINGAAGVKFWIEGKEFWWVKNCYVSCKIAA